MTDYAIGLIMLAIWLPPIIIVVAGRMWWWFFYAAEDASFWWGKETAWREPENMFAVVAWPITVSAFIIMAVLDKWLLGLLILRNRRFKRDPPEEVQPGTWTPFGVITMDDVEKWKADCDRMRELEDEDR